MKLIIKKSKTLTALATAAYAGAAFVALFLPIGLGGQALVIGVVLTAWQRAWRRWSWNTVSEAELDEKGRVRFRSEPVWCRVVRAARDPFAVRLMIEGPDGRRRPLLIARDAVDAATYHELGGRIAQRRLPFPEVEP